MEAPLRFQVGPARLAFYGEDMPDATQVITVRNLGDEPLRVKLLCTSSQIFSVRPIRTTIAPGTTGDIVVRLKTMEAPGKHKFMVQVVDEADRELANEKRSAMVYPTREAARAAPSGAASLESPSRATSTSRVAAPSSADPVRAGCLADPAPGLARRRARSSCRARRTPSGLADRQGAFRLIHRTGQEERANGGASSPAPAPAAPRGPGPRPNRLRTAVIVAAVALAASSWLGLATVLPTTVRDAVEAYLTFSPAQLVYGGFIAGLAVGMSIR